jgi:NitT/TauT family transport system ATP-binding protein
VKHFVNINNVSLNYGHEFETLALHEATIQVDKGQLIAVVGPSGCGKSSLMKIVTGLEPVSAGWIEVGGNKVKGPQNNVGMAFQNPSLLPWRTILENILLPLEIVEPYATTFKKSINDYKNKALKLLKTVGLQGAENKYPWQLSGGMQQRAQLCRAVIHEPELLMLDEPFGALDMFTREELWLVLQNLWISKNHTIILVTHDLREALFLADKIFVMSARPGKIISEFLIDEPRPRELKLLYTDKSAKILSELRDSIHFARSDNKLNSVPAM